MEAPGFSDILVTMHNNKLLHFQKYSSFHIFIGYALTFWSRNYFFNFSTSCIQNVNNTGTKYVRIMKQTTF